QLAEPAVLLVELQRRAVEVEPVEREDPEADLDERDERRERADHVPRHRHDPEQEPRRHRQHDQDRREPLRHLVTRKTTARTAPPLVSARAYPRTTPFCTRLTSPAPNRTLRVSSPIEPSTTGCSK